jgi:hypothetical protein
MGGVAGGFDVGSSGGLRVGMRPGDLPRPSPGALAFLVQASAALSEVLFPPISFSSHQANKRPTRTSH